jgi:hypothetical protein
MRALRIAAVLSALLLLPAVAEAGVIKFDTGFTADPTVSIVSPDNTLAIFKQDDGTSGDPDPKHVQLVNDPSAGDTVLISAKAGMLLAFDYELYEWPRDGSGPTGNTETLWAGLLNANTGAKLGGSYEFTADMGESGTVYWNLTSIAGKDVGIRFEMISSSSDPLTNGHLNVSNLRIVPAPGALLSGLALLGAGLFLRIRRRRR